MMEHGTNFNFNYNKGLNRFSLSLSMKDIKISKSALHNNVDTLFETDSYTQIGFLSFKKCGKLYKINIYKCWYRRLIRYIKDKLSQLKRE